MSMTDLPIPTPFPLATQAEDLRAAFAGVAPGPYRSVDLLPRYNAWAKANGKPEVTRKALGEAIARTWRPEMRWAHGHVRVFVLTAEHLNES
jgi:hypothetical protein